MKLTLSRTLPYGSTFGGVAHLVEFDLGARQRARQGAVFREDNRVAVGITTGHGHLSAGIHTNQKGLPVKPIKSTMTVLKQVAELIPAYANRNRNADMAEELFWCTLADLQSQAPTFGMGRNYVGFPRLFTVLRAVLWNRLDMYSVLYFCGTASDPPPLRTRPGQAWLPGLDPTPMGQQA